MKLLALDTSSSACSVALLCDEEVTERHVVQAREHTKLLTPMIRSVLAEGAAALRDLDAIILGNGPGSFIGMRIAASVAQGLAYGADLRIVPVSSLAAVAAEVLAVSDADEVIVAQDARMSEVYLGGYGRGEGNLPEPLFAERLQGHTVIDELDSSGATNRLAAGCGWQRYPDLAALNEAFFGGIADVQYPRARFLLALGALGLARGLDIEPTKIVPAYLRHKVAEKPAAKGP